MIGSEFIYKSFVYAGKALNDLSETIKDKKVIKPGILPKKGGKKNKNVYYGRRY